MVKDGDFMWGYKFYCGIECVVDGEVEVGV